MKTYHDIRDIEFEDDFLLVTIDGDLNSSEIRNDHFT